MVSVDEDPQQGQQWVRQVGEEAERVGLQQLSLIYGGLIVIGVYLVQPFLTASSLDLSAKVCVVAFSVAIPLLASLVLVNQLEVFRRRVTRSVVVEVARVVAQVCVYVGVMAGFWHILWIAGVGTLAGGLVGVAVLSAGYWYVERDQEPTPQEGDEPGDAEALALRRWVSQVRVGCARLACLPAAPAITLWSTDSGSSFMQLAGARAGARGAGCIRAPGLAELGS